MANPGVIAAVDQPSLSQFDMIIDARSPGEFAEDRIPGAVNLPVLDDEERRIVGTMYVQESRFLARRTGAAMVARNVARHLDSALAGQSSSFKPLVYCWRGGQRSGAMATILSQVGWRTVVLEGGYRTYRRWVQKRLYEHALDHRLVLLDGGTGTGKTLILQRLAQMGAQVIDLEALAAHRGSLFGAMTQTPQPSQKLFETGLVQRLDSYDPARPVIVEAESNKIGDRTLPPSIWTAMKAAPAIELSAPIEARAHYLVEAYPELSADHGLLERVLARLEVYPGRKRLADWRVLADAGDYASLAREVLQLHYDPSYSRSSRRSARERLGAVEMASLDAGEQARAADAIIDRVKQAFGGI